MAAAPSVRLISVSLAAADDGTGGELSCNVRVSGSSTSLALSYLTAQLGLAPAPLYTARVYPNAYMYALHRPARQFRLDDDSGCIRLSGLDTSTEYVLALGVRDQDEYVAAQSALLGPATPGAADGFDVGAGKPFQLNLSDIHIASILSEAVNTADYQSRLTEPILSSFRGSPAVWSLVNPSNLLNVKDAATPYLLALTQHTDSPGLMAPYRRDHGYGQTLWVVFAHTKDVRNVMADVTVLGASTPIGQIHAGFYAKVASIAAHLQRFAEESQCSIAPGSTQPLRLIFTGHSLGGALAQACCLHLLAAGGVVGGSQYQIGSISFGNPYVGNGNVREFVEQRGWSDRLLSVVNKDDIVPNLLNYVESAHLLHRNAGRVVQQLCDICDLVGDVVGFAPITRRILLGLPSTLTTLADLLRQTTPAYEPIGTYGMISAETRQVINNDGTTSPVAYTALVLNSPQETQAWMSAQYERIIRASVTALEQSLSHRMLQYRDAVLACDNVAETVDCTHNIAPQPNRRGAREAGEAKEGKEEAEEKAKEKAEVYLIPFALEQLHPLVESVMVVMWLNGLKVTIRGQSLDFLNHRAADYFRTDLKLNPGAAMEADQPTRGQAIITARVVDSGHLVTPFAGQQSTRRSASLSALCSSRPPLCPSRALWRPRLTLTTSCTCYPSSRSTRCPWRC